MGSGLECLVHILHSYCIPPTPPENPAFVYGLFPLDSRPPEPTLCLNPKSFNEQAAYRFSVAFQCVVNIGVRWSEPIQSRVFQAGTLEVIGCILEAWLTSKGFAIGPSSSASGMPRETRERRLAQRQTQAEQRQRDQAAQLSRALQCQIVNDDFGRYDRSTPAIIDTCVAQVSLYHAIAQQMITHRRTPLRTKPWPTRPKIHPHLPPQSILRPPLKPLSGALRFVQSPRWELSPFPLVSGAEQ